MTFVVDIRDWLDRQGNLPTRPSPLRRNARRVATFVEYSADLEAGEGRETLVECRRRPRGHECLGLIWVVKLPDERIEAFCMACGETEALISGWQDTQWGQGLMEPVPIMTDPGSGDSGGGGTRRHR